MERIRALALVIILFLYGPAAHAQLHTRDDVRQMYAALVTDRDESPYAAEPSVSGVYFAGALTETAAGDALAYVNFIRALAYLDDDVTLSELYALRAQHAAVLLAANDDLAHDAPQPENMPDDFYQTAHTGTMASNIAAINWMENDILLTAVEYFVRDDGEINLSTLGHRRWLLSPYLGATGFGLANAESGMSYAAMYAVDMSADAGEWNDVKWPSEGAFPADLTSADIPWSVTLNPDAYSDVLSGVTVEIFEETAGEAPLSYFSVSADPYGAGPCVIFMPDLGAIGISDYQQNQTWHVRIGGLIASDGSEASIEYTVDMISLYPIDPAAVEAEPRALELSAGDTFTMRALVVPEWADDVSVAWSSTDESVAVVDESGVVTAVAPGECGIIAASVNGRTDECRITVK